MDQGSHASEPSALGSQDSVTAFEDNDVCEGDESMGSWTVDDDPPSKKSATRPSGMADLALGRAPNEYFLFLEFFGKTTIALQHCHIPPAAPWATRTAPFASCSRQTSVPWG